MRTDYEKFVAAGAEILVVAPDDPADLRKYWAAEHLPFPGLADPDHAVAGRYHQEVNLLRLGRMPAVLIVDRAGNVDFQHYGRSMADIPPNAEVLDRLAQIDAELAGGETPG